MDKKKQRPSGQNEQPAALNDECAGCNVVHVDFRGAVADEAPLTSAEIAGIRTVFSKCPIAMKALQGTLK